MGTTRPPVALIGIGLMGAAITTRRLERGHQVAVVDRDPPKVANVVAKGAIAAADQAAAARQVEFVITSLNARGIARQVVLGPNGVADGAAAGKRLLDGCAAGKAAGTESR